MSASLVSLSGRTLSAAVSAARANAPALLKKARQMAEGMSTAAPGSGVAEKTIGSVLATPSGQKAVASAALDLKFSSDSDLMSIAKDRMRSMAVLLSMQQSGHSIENLMSPYASEADRAILAAHGIELWIAEVKETIAENVRIDASQPMSNLQFTAVMTERRKHMVDIAGRIGLNGSTPSATFKNMLELDSVLDHLTPEFMAWLVQSEE